ncbi:hypothetical protein AKO1_007913 [Acrasis kona]|uniref:SS18 N-terminal domain-containing protein n=1 Tax=Acrasis kona TaxID=1008807 RepID=A0AAW2YPA7_9EUKA
MFTKLYSQPEPQTYSTDKIQQLLEENQLIIHAIIERQKMKKYDECEKYQEQLQKNLVKLAYIADYQPSLQPKPTSPTINGANQTTQIHPSLQQPKQQIPPQLQQQFRQ